VQCSAVQCSAVQCNSIKLLFIIEMSTCNPTQCTNQTLRIPVVLLLLRPAALSESPAGFLHDREAE
jgi:hypothetical protein